MYHAIKQHPDELKEKARAAATVLGAAKHAAIRISYTKFLTRLKKKAADNTLSEKGLAGLAFLEYARHACPTDSALVEFLLFSWMQVAKSMNAGAITMENEAVSDTVVGVFMFAGIKLKVTH